MDFITSLLLGWVLFLSPPTLDDFKGKPYQSPAMKSHVTHDLTKPVVARFCTNSAGQPYILLPPTITALLTDTLVSPDTGIQGASPGDYIEYTLVISNQSSTDNASGITSTLYLDENTSYKPNSLKSSVIGIDDAYNVIGNMSISVPALDGVLKNDINLDNDALTVTMTDQSSLQGSLNLQSNGAFTFNPAAGFRGTTSFTYSVSDGTFISTGRVTFTIANMVWFIRTGSTSPGDGRLSSPFSSIGNFNNLASDQAGDKIFLYSGTYSSALTLLDRQWLIGQGTTAATFYAACGLTTPAFPVNPVFSLPVPGGTNPNLSSSTTTITTGKKNRITGVNCNNSGGTALTANTFDSLYVRQVSVINSSGPAMQLNKGYLDAELLQVSSTGGIFGMKITETTGALKVTGTGTTDNTGGIIQGFSQRGIDIQNATNIELSNIKLESNAISANQSDCLDNANTSCYAALHASMVTGLTVKNIDIPSCSATGINLHKVKNLDVDACTVKQTGNTFFENGMTAVNVSGNCNIKQSSFIQPASKALSIYRNTSDTLQLTIQNSTFADSYTALTGQDLLECLTYNNGLTKIQMSGCRLKKAKTKALQLVADDNSLIQFSMTGCDVVTDNTAMAGLDLSATGNAKIDYNIIQNDSIQSRGEVAVLSYAGGTGKMEGRLNLNNLIQKTSDTTDVFSNVRILQEDTGWGKVEVKSNTNLQLIRGEAALQGISRASATSGGRLDVSTISNSITTDINSLEGIEMRSGSALTGTEVNTGCIHAASNTVTAASTRAFRVRQVNAATQMLVQGVGGSLSTNWTSNGNSNTGGAILSSGTLTYGATCLIPAHTTLTTTYTEQNLADGGAENYPVLPDVAPDNSGVAASPNETRGTSAYSPSGQQLTVTGFSLPANKSITIKWQVQIQATIPAGTCNLASQSKIEGSNFSAVYSDDPASTLASDSTFTDLVIPVAITCPTAQMVAITNSNCTSTQTFAATAVGCPSPTIQYSIQHQTITFPYEFSPGQTIIVAKATNSLPSTDSCTFTITVDQKHQAYLVTGSDTLCANGPGASITLADSDTGISYQLIKDGTATGTVQSGTGSSLTFSGLSQSGVYKVQGVATSGCTVPMTDSARVLIVSLPDAGTGADTTLCGTTTTLLTGSAANGSGNWSVKTGPSLSAGQFSTVSGTNTQFTASGGAGVYENLWIVRNDACPSDTAFYKVIIKNVPLANAGNDTTLCLGESITLRASADNGTGIWQVVANPAGSNPQLSNNILSHATFSSDKNGMYALAWNVSEPGCPTKRDTVKITVFLNPDAFLTASQTICSGMSLLPLIANSATATFSYQWSRDNLQNTSGIMQSGQDSIPGKLLNVTNTPQDVTFTVTAGQCRVREFTSLVTVNPSPAAIFSLEEVSGLLSNDGRICAGDSIRISVAGAATYLWGTGETTQTISKAPIDSTMYRVQMVSIDGCTGRDSVYVKVFQNPTGQVLVTDVSGVTANDAIICLGDSLQIQATSGLSYLWSGGQTESSIRIRPISGQLVTVRMTNAVGCSDVDSVQVQVNPLPSVQISVEENSVTPNDGIVCRGSTAVLKAGGALQYSWSTGQTSAQIEVQPESTVNYIVAGTDAAGCANQDSVILRVKILPNVSITGPGVMVCAGEGGQLSASGGTAYSWSDGQTGAVITVNPPKTTTYIVTISDIDGCTATAAVVYMVDLCCVKPTLSIGKIMQPTCQQGGSVELSGLPNGNWTLFQRGIIQKVYSASGNQFTATDIPEGVYRFQVADENGCISLLTPPFQAILINH